MKKVRIFLIIFIIAILSLYIYKMVFIAKMIKNQHLDKETYKLNFNQNEVEKSMLITELNGVNEKTLYLKNENYLISFKAVDQGNGIFDYNYNTVNDYIGIPLSQKVISNSILTQISDSDILHLNLILNETKVLPKKYNYDEIRKYNMNSEENNNKEYYIFNDYLDNNKVLFSQTFRLRKYTENGKDFYRGYIDTDNYNKIEEHKNVIMYGYSVPNKNILIDDSSAEKLYNYLENFFK